MQRVFLGRISRLGGRLAGGVHRVKAEGNLEGGALSGLAAQLDGAAHEIHQPLGDAQSQAGAFYPADMVAAGKGLKQMGLKFLAHADAGVLHGKLVSDLAGFVGGKGGSPSCFAPHSDRVSREGATLYSKCSSRDRAEKNWNWIRSSPGKGKPLIPGGRNGRKGKLSPKTPGKKCEKSLILGQNEMDVILLDKEMGMYNAKLCGIC